MGRPQVADRDGFQIWRVATYILNKQSRTADRGWPSSLGVWQGLTTPTIKIVYVAPPRKWTDYLARPKHRKIDEELHILYSSPNIIRKIKSRRMRWEDQIKENEVGRSNQGE
jgi:hypothetical protein